MLNNNNETISSSASNTIDSQPTVVENTIFEDSQKPATTEEVKFTKDKATGKITNNDPNADYEQDLTDYIDNAIKNGEEITDENVSDLLKYMGKNGGDIVKRALNNHGVNSFDALNKNIKSGKYSYNNNAETNKVKVEAPAKNKTAKKVEAPVAETAPVQNISTVDYTTITPDNYKNTSGTTAKDMVEYLKGKNGKITKEVLDYVGISDNLDGRIANAYGYSVAELNKMKKDGIPDSKFDRNRFISKGLSESQKKEADTLLDIIDDPNSTDIDKENAKARLLNIQAVSQSMNSVADIISNAAHAAEQTKSSSKSLVDPQYLENLPKSLIQAYKSGKFGNPESDDAKARLGYFIMDNIATGLSNFRIARTSPAFGDKQSRYDKYLDTELTNAMQRKNDSINKINDSTLELLKKGGLNEVDFDNAVANWSKDDTLKNYTEQLNATQKAAAVLADKELGVFLSNLSQEDRNNASYAAILLAKGDVNEAIPMLMASGIDVDGYLDALAKTAKSDATMSKYVTMAINQKNALEQQNNATSNAIRQAQVNFDNDVAKLDISYQQEMNKLKQNLLNGEELVKVQAEWNNWLDKKESWRKVGQSVVTSGLDVLKSTAEGLGEGVGMAAGMGGL